MINFPVLKLQVYLLRVHTFHTPVSHTHPDVTITHNKLSVSICLFIVQLDHKSFPYLTHAAQEQRAAGPTLEGPGADAEAGVCGALGGRLPAAAEGGGGNTEALSDLLQRAERKPGSALQSCVRSLLELTTKQQWASQRV